MKTLLNCLLIATAMVTIGAADEALVSKLQAADDARVAATKAADVAQLEAIISDDLHYAHSNGLVDTKDSFIELVTSGKTKYVEISYEERKFTFPAPQVALMTGRARIVVQTANGGMDSVLSFLAVWRQEADGKWRFLAWQSCRLPPK